MQKLILIIFIVVIAGGGYYYLSRDTAPYEPVETEETSPTPTPEAEETTLPAVPTPVPTPLPTQVPTETPTPEPAPEPTPPLVGYTITADDNQYSAEPSPIVFTVGDRAVIMFQVSDQNVYFGGLEFRGGPIDTESIPPGKSQTISFTPESSFTITAYWPASGVVKYTIPVQVNAQ